MTEHGSKIIFAGKTDPGRKRTNNEDAFVVQSLWDHDHILAVTIDGVGGYEGGEVAAAIAAKSIVEYLEKYPNGERFDLLKQAVVFANNSIFEERQKQTNLAHMSCVLTAVLVEVEQQQVNMVHVGDSRLYQFHRGKLKKLSHDHSLVGYREEVGDLTEEEAMRHPQRNIINRDVGSAHHEIDDRDFLETAVFPLLPNSTLLLCSDGLSDMLTSAQMKQVLQRSCSLEEKTKALIDAANEAGGKDNITVVLVEDQREDIDEPHTTDEHAVHPKLPVENQESTMIVPQRPASVTKRVVTLLLFILLGAVFGWVAREKRGFTAGELPLAVPVQYDSLQLFILDSLVIVNHADTLLIRDSLSSEIDGIWVKEIKK